MPCQQESEQRKRDGGMEGGGAAPQSQEQQSSHQKPRDDVLSRDVSNELSSRPEKDSSGSKEGGEGAEAEEGTEGEGAAEGGGGGGGGGSKGGSKKRNRKKSKASARARAQDEAYVPTYFQANLKVSRVEGRGRCAVASRDLKAGELVFEEEPVALVIFRQHAGSVCHLCGRASPRRFFEGLPYCTEACLDKHRDVRKAAQDALLAVDNISREADVDADLLRMVILLISKRHVLLQKGDAGAAQVWNSLTGLMDHKEAMSAAFLTTVREGVSRALLFLPEEVRIPEEEAVRLACIVNVNSHGANLSTSYNATAGFGMFPLLAILNHSCRPNCAFVFIEGVMKVRALEDLPSGTELCVPYINLLQSRPARQRELRDTKYFTCTCVRCQHESPADILLGAVCCASCGERGIITTTTTSSSSSSSSRRQAASGEGGEVAVIDWAAKDDTGSEPPPKGGDGGDKGGGDATAAPPPSSPTSTSVLPPQPPPPQAVTGKGAGDGGGDNGVATITTEEKKPQPPPSLKCCTCPAIFTPVQVRDYLHHFIKQKDQALLLLQGRAYPAVRTRIERLLAQNDASSSSSSSSGGGLSGRSSSSLKLHPSHQLVLECLPALVNCCNNLQDFSSACTVLRRILSSMSSLYPPHFPELADYYAALGGALHNHIRPPKTMLRKTLASHRAEIRACFQRAYEIRRVAMGDDHPLTIEAKDKVEAMACA